MTKEEADLELKEIKNKLSRIDRLRVRLDGAEQALCLREHTLMLEYYPEVIDAQIQRVMQLRRQRRGY